MQRPTKRTRIDDGSAVELLRRDTSRAETRGGDSHESGNSQAIDEFVTKFVKKIHKGLKKLQKESVGLFPSEELGMLLFKHRQDAIESRQNGNPQDAGKLGALLEKQLLSQKDTKWLTDMLLLFVSFRRRRLNPAYTKTSDPEKERNLRAQENICGVLNNVADGLEPSWGAYAIVLYGAFEGK